MNSKKQLDIYFSMLREFDYEKNGNEETIKFLAWVLDNLINMEE